MLRAWKFSDVILMVLVSICGTAVGTTGGRLHSGGSQLMSFVCHHTMIEAKNMPKSRKCLNFILEYDMLFETIILSLR